MRVDLMLVTLQNDEPPRASFYPAETVRDSLGLWERPESMSVHLGSLGLTRPPRIVIETLGQALTEFYERKNGDGKGLDTEVIIDSIEYLSPPPRRSETPAPSGRESKR